MLAGKIVYQQYAVLHGILLLFAGSNSVVDKVIIVLSAGVSSESSAVVKQTISAGKQLVGDVSIIAFGLDVGQ